MSERKCRDCPVRPTTHGGVMQVDSNQLMKCCKVHAQIRALGNLRLPAKIPDSAVMGGIVLETSDE